MANFITCFIITAYYTNITYMPIMSLSGSLLGLFCISYQLMIILLLAISRVLIYLEMAFPGGQS